MFISYMKVDVLFGLQWGDEGKGKIVDVFILKYDIIVCFQGGLNVGYMFEFEGIKYVLYIIFFGIFYGNVVNFIGNGVVIDFVVFKIELDKLKLYNIDFVLCLIIFKKVYFILFIYCLFDVVLEMVKGKNKIGFIFKGIGLVYMDKMG